LVRAIGTIEDFDQAMGVTNGEEAPSRREFDGAGVWPKRAGHRIFGYDLPCRPVPDSNDVVGRIGGQQCAIRTEGDRENARLRPEPVHFLERVQIPNPDTRAGGNKGAVLSRKQDGSDLSWMDQGGQWFSGCFTPKVDFASKISRRHH
jgi:hypothetical protein